MTVEEIKAEIPKLTPAELIEFETALKLAIASNRASSSKSNPQAASTESTASNPSHQ